MKERFGNNIHRWLPGVLVVVFAAAALMSIKSPPNKTAFDLTGFGRLPVLNGGRLKPLDSVARSALLIISGKQTIRVDAGKKSATEWMVDMLFNSAQADRAQVFQINDPDVLGIMGLEQSKNRFYSLDQLRPHLEEIENQAERAHQTKAPQRSRFERAIVGLNNQLVLYQRIQNSLQVSGEDNSLEALMHFEKILLPIIESHLNNPAAASEFLPMLAGHLERFQFVDRLAEFYPIPSRIDQQGVDGWVSMGRGIMDRRSMSIFHPAVTSYAAMGDAVRKGDAAIFNKSLTLYRVWLDQNIPAVVNKVNHEVWFNNSQPFMLSMMMYVVVFLLAVFSWMVWPKALGPSATHVLTLAFIVHTIGLVSRMVIQGRPPVTNLYSSAVFVGWVAVLLGVILERLNRKRILTAVAAMIGFVTLIIAHHLTAQGDTLEMMRAVLDSNFWLATHVVTITIGYSSTFLSGFLAILYIFRDRFDPRWNQESAMAVEKTVYGIVCFNLFFSFVGTILGGIWADQSWGRFWGWDPKENGALMIVLWNAFILHARWGGFVKRRGFMSLAVGGNIVTALSWFGVNMLGIGLHSYGFMDKAFVWLLLFSFSQLAVVALAYWSGRGDSGGAK